MNISAFFLVGPTAVGKSSVAQYIAEREKYAVLSADSMLVYKGMDVGTAKPLKEERSRVVYGGIDIVKVGENFSVADYRCHAIEFVREMKKKNIPVIVVGGSGLYVKSLTHGLDCAERANPTEREKWMKVFEKGGLEALQTEVLKKYSQARIKPKDFSNPRRLMRYLERENVELLNVRSWQKTMQPIPMAGLDMPTDIFRKAVQQRVEWMYEHGLVEETKSLIAKGGVLSGTAGQAIGYAEAIAFIENKISREEAIKKTISRTIRLGKKQRTWFRWQAKVEWIIVNPEMKIEEVAARVVSIWDKYGPLPIYETKEM